MIKKNFLYWLIPALAVMVFIGMIPFLSAFSGFAIFIVWALCVMVWLGMSNNPKLFKEAVIGAMTNKTVDNRQFYISSASLLGVLLLGGHLLTAIAGVVTYAVVWAAATKIKREYNAENPDV